MNRNLGQTADLPFYFSLIIAGFGGQGVLLIGNLFAYGAMKEGRQVSYLPIYGVEMRGGTADCTIVVASREIGSPLVSKAHSVIVMNPSSLEKYENRLQPRGLLLINSSLVEPEKVTRQDIELLAVPANNIANEEGNPRLANMIALGAFLEKTKLIRMDSLLLSFERVLDTRHHSLIPSNIKAVQKGASYVRSLP
jgi:2-oxoglutarate ferredoxin oxidoreductase subunit gamma